ncbi:MAG: sulfotransferase [Deltaproteobacteria bacterium]|nr:sulfotransferase [Deltaproteobacteria bacterium]
MTSGNPRPSALARAFNLGGRAMQEAGVPYPSLEPEALLASAIRRAGLEDFGDEAFREPFHRLVESLARESELTPFGQIAARRDLVRVLSNKLRMTEDRRRHPEIAEGPVPRPIFITGMPRTGTTFLHGLLAQDPASRSPLAWETMYPSPPPQRSRYKSDRRIEMAHRQMRWLYRIIPEFRRIHAVDARLPQECLVITTHSFLSFQPQTTHFVPSYQTWLEEQDLRSSYAVHRQFLEHLQWRCPGERWVLKAPAHIFGFEELFDVYPDALVVMTHRAPLEVVGSLGSLTSVLRSAFSDTVDPVRVGPEMTERWSRGLDRALQARDSGRVPAGQILDVDYGELTRDPIGTARRIYRSFDIPFTPAADQAMTEFLGQNRKDRHGRHEYTLAQFGLDAETEAARYKAYAERFHLACGLSE